MNGEQKVLDDIDALVSNSLAQPIVDDYGVNRYERCELCRRDWHGLPTMDESCPGAWASDDAKAAWREMFPPPQPNALGPNWTTSGGRLLHLPVQTDNQILSLAHLRGFSWVFTDQAQTWILNGQLGFQECNFRVLLYDAAMQELPTNGGYTHGGLRVSMAISVSGTAGRSRVDVTFTANPVWIGTGRGFTAMYAVLTWNDMAIASCRIDTPTISRGASLTIDNSSTPLLCLEWG